MKTLSVIGFALLLSLASCASLRSGWVKVDFMEGQPSEFLVCQLTTKDGEMSAKCVSMESVEREMARRRAAEQGDL